MQQTYVMQYQRCENAIEDFFERLAIFESLHHLRHDIIGHPEGTGMRRFVGMGVYDR